MAKYTREQKVEVLVYKLKHPKLSYQDIAYKFNLSKSTITHWSNDSEIVEEAMKYMDDPNGKAKLETLKIERKLVDRREVVKDMLFDTLENIFNDMDIIKTADKIRFAHVLKEVSVSDVFNLKTQKESKSIVLELMERYGIQGTGKSSNIGQA